MQTSVSQKSAGICFLNTGINDMIHYARLCFEVQMSPHRAKLGHLIPSYSYNMGGFWKPGEVVAI